MIDINNLAIRKIILDETESMQNKERKATSLAQFDIYKDRILPYVQRYLRNFYQEETISSLPVIASINLCKRIVDKEAAIYDSAPKRTFTNVSKQQQEQLENLYKDLRVNVYLKKSNRYYKLQEQSHVQVLPVNGKLKLRTLLAHHIDVVPSPLDPEIAEAYLIKGFDRSQFVPTLENSDGINQTIADEDDYKGTLNQVAWWSKDFNFITNKEGQIISGDDVTNPINELPIIDISDAKDAEYWVRRGASVTDFTIQFNGSLTDLGQIVRMQGFSQAVIKGSEEMFAALKNMQIGPNFVLKLPINPDRPAETDFSFASPSPDIGGSIQFTEMLLSSFISSRGLDPSLVNTKGTSTNFTSGVERLLSMIEMFKPSKEDFSLFESVEKQLFKIIKTYINTYNGTDVLGYDIGLIPENADVEIEFAEPQAIQTPQEKIEFVRSQVELGLMSDIEGISILRNVSMDEAKRIKSEIDSSLLVQRG